MMDITSVVLTAFLRWLRIMRIFSQAFGLRWLLKTGMEEDEEAILQVSMSFGGWWDHKGRGPASWLCLHVQGKALVHQIQHSRGQKASLWEEEGDIKTLLASTLGRVLRRMAWSDSRIKRRWWRDQERMAEDSQEAPILTEEGESWWPEHGGHNGGSRSGQDVDGSFIFPQSDLLSHAVNYEDSAVSV